VLKSGVCIRLTAEIGAARNIIRIDFSFGDIGRLPLFLKTPQENRNEFKYTGKALHQALSIEHV
jgi:hypothetical protein